MSNVVKLAEALLRRKELQEKVDQLAKVKNDQTYQVIVKRQRISDDFDEIQAAVPRVTMPQVTAAYDWHAKQLRLVDAAIQQANWVTDVEVADTVFAEYKEAEGLIETKRTLGSSESR